MISTVSVPAWEEGWTENAVLTLGTCEAIGMNKTAPTRIMLLMNFVRISALRFSDDIVDASSMVVSLGDPLSASAGSFRVTDVGVGGFGRGRGRAFSTGEVEIDLDCEGGELLLLR